jgi:radical SAM superfamily enzyme YgiQ (UPF0313 family)
VALFDFSNYEIFNDKSYESLFFKECQFDVLKVGKERTDFYGGSIDLGVDLLTTDYAKDLRHTMIMFRPDIVAVSCLSVDFDFVVERLKSLKEEFGFKVIFGGIHAILLPEEVINNDICDFVCTGEGEVSFVQLLDTLDQETSLLSVKGIWFKMGGEIHRNEMSELTNLSKLPFLDLSDFDPIHFYRPFDGKRYKMVNYELSRGCPFFCSYCVNGTLKKKYAGLGKYHRIKTVGQAIDELKSLIQKYDFEFVRFWDEDFMAIPEQTATEFAQRYKEEISLPFIIYARVESVTVRKVELLKDMGCRTFAMGIESGNEFIRRNVLNRHMSNETIRKTFSLVKSYGIRVSAYNMIGLPLENRDSIFDTVELNRDVEADSFSVTLLEPYQGTPIRELCEKEGMNRQHRTAYNRVQFVPKGMTEKELQGLFRTFKFYVKSDKVNWDIIKQAETDDAIYEKLLKGSESDNT